MANVSTHCAIYIKAAITGVKCGDINLLSTSLASHIVHERLRPNGFLTRWNQK